MKIRNTIFAVVVLSLAAAAWVAWSGRGGVPRGPDPLVLGPPIATVRFGDRSVLEIFGLAEDEWVDGIMARPSGSGWGNSSSGAVTSAFGPEKDFLQIERFTLNEKLAGVRLSPGAGKLVMSMRFSNPAGNALSPEGMKPGQLQVRLHDGAGDWIDGSGPFGAGDDPEARGVVSFAGWPRTGSELVFQAVLAGQPPVEFRLPQPFPGASPAVWAGAPLPQVRSGEYWEVRLARVWETTVSGKGRLLVPEIGFAAEFPGSGRFAPVRYNLEGVHGSKGTRSERGIHFDHDGRLVSGYPMPPDEDLFKVPVRIQYEPPYPFPRTGVKILACGTVSADVSRIDVTSKHPAFGIESIDLGPIGSGKDAWFAAEHSFPISFAGNWSTDAERAAAESAMGPWKEWTPVAFLAEGEHSSGAVQLDGSQVSSGIAAGSFAWKGRWAGELKPGTKVEVGLMRRKPDDLLEFIVERSGLSPR